MDVFGEVFFCVCCGDPIQFPRRGVLQTQVIAYTEGLREVIVTLGGRQIHNCSFVAASMDSDSSD
jgi:hypothetical protein